LDTAALAAGGHTVEVEAVDPSPKVRRDPSRILARKAAWTILVFDPIFAPLEFSGRKVLNRMVLKGEYINVLTWKADPRNERLGGYALYVLEGGEKRLLARLGPNELELRHRNVGRDSVLTYVLQASNPEGIEGEPATVTVR
jgi:hypothetical protein